jgi:hypothetical protein
MKQGSQNTWHTLSQTGPDEERRHEQLHFPWWGWLLSTEETKKLTPEWKLKHISASDLMPAKGYSQEPGKCNVATSQSKLQRVIPIPSPQPYLNAIQFILRFGKQSGREPPLIQCPKGKIATCKSSGLLPRNCSHEPITQGQRAWLTADQAKTTAKPLALANQNQNFWIRVVPGN